jgi:hypothetical protein
MKIHNTQRLFWKKWTIKVIIKIEPARGMYYGHRMAREDLDKRRTNISLVKDWFSKNMPEAGIRAESNLSIFLNTKEDLDKVIDEFGSRVIEVWQPESDTAKELMMEHGYDVIRKTLWYGRFPIRARINYNENFRQNGVGSFKDAVNGLDENDWYCAGMLKTILDNKILPRIYGWGQPLHLYLANAEDAAMMRLQCGDFIERFERIRSPE